MSNDTLMLLTWMCNILDKHDLVDAHPVTLIQHFIWRSIQAAEKGIRHG